MVFFAEISFRNMDSSAAVEERIRRVSASLSRASHSAASWSGEGWQGQGQHQHQDRKTPPASAPVRGGLLRAGSCAVFAVHRGAHTTAAC